jgi:diguanylate cyclase (GGDEF)-like protein
VAVVSVLACLSVTTLGLRGSELATPFGAAVSGLTAIVGGFVVLGQALSVARRRPELFRILIGSAALVWGLGQLVVGWLINQGATYPTVGDHIASMAAPLAIAGLALSPRRASEPMAGLRLTCDALVAGGAAAALIWRVGFTDLVDVGTVDGLISVSVLLLELSVAALLFVAALRELDAGMVTAALGVGIFVVADVATQIALLQPDGGWPWQAMALVCLSWPLICLGLIRISADPPDISDRERPASEQRRVVVGGVVTTGLLIGLVLSVAFDPSVNVVTVALLGVSFVAAAVRDVIVAGQARALLTRVSTLAYLDALTGLANRRALLERLAVLPDGDDGWLLTVDLDNFKHVNGLLGHGGGDELLVQTAIRLGEAAAPHEVFRLGGDEFAVVASGDREEVERLAERLLVAVRLAALSVPGVGQVALSASVGVAGRGPAEVPLAVLAESTAALQAAKAAGRNRCVVYAGDVAVRSARRHQVEVRLREAIRSNSVTLHAQPVVRLGTGELVGLEMLARWTDPELGRVGPDEFIDIAEASALVVPLGEQLIEVALAAAVEHRLHERDITFGVNISAVQLRVPGFADHLLERMQHHGVPAQRFVLEVTESVFIDESDPAEEQLVALAAHGIPVAVDDFGAGAASVGYLRRLPARILKIDRSLVGAMRHDPTAAAIVRSVAWLGAETGLDVCAEGIEDEETAQACRDAGIPFGQGWHYSRDVPLDQVETLLSAGPLGPVRTAARS